MTLRDAETLCERASVDEPRERFHRYEERDRQTTRASAER